MNRSIFSKSVARRTVLSGVGAGVAGMLLRPLQAQEAGPPPTRLLIVHRPCGTVLERFFPAAGSATDFQLTPILQSFAPLKSEMVILNGVNCPRDQGWPADQHAAGLITMMCGKRFIPIPGTDAGGDPNAKNIVAPDKTIDQHLLSVAPALGGARIGSLQAAAYRPSSVGLPSFKVMSYDGPNGALFPESVPQNLFDFVFGGDSSGLSPEQIARRAAQNRSVLDRVNADLARLQGLIPASQKPKLDSHLAGIQALEKQLQSSTMPVDATCQKPTLTPLPNVPSGVTVDEAQHLVAAQNQLAVIQAAFQCDLTRVATFSFAHGNSDLRFQKIDPAVTKGDGHHGVSHDTSAGAAQERIDQIYCEQLSAFLQKMKTVQEGSGTLLDNTLVVFFNECAIGNTHSIENMPVLMFGGKSLGLRAGQHLQLAKGSTMNDVWAAVCGAFKVEAKFGDQAFAKGPASGLFA